MSARFETLSFLFETADGTGPQPVPSGVTVKARIEGAGSDVATYITDTDGRVVADSISTATGGDIVHFRIENYNGMAASVAVRVK